MHCLYRVVASIHMAAVLSSLKCVGKGGREGLKHVLQVQVPRQSPQHRSIHRILPLLADPQPLQQVTFCSLTPHLISVLFFHFYWYCLSHLLFSLFFCILFLLNASFLSSSAFLLFISIFIFFLFLLFTYFFLILQDKHHLYRHLLKDTWPRLKTLSLSNRSHHLFQIPRYLHLRLPYIMVVSD